MAATWLILLVAQLGLQLLTILTLRRVLAGLTRWPWQLRAFTPARIGWAVRAVSRAVPGVTCLGQALAAEALLRRLGDPGGLALGLARDEAGRLQGHAWLECEGTLVVGGEDVSRYTRLAVPRPIGKRAS